MLYRTFKGQRKPREEDITLPCTIIKLAQDGDQNPAEWRTTVMTPMTPIYKKGDFYNYSNMEIWNGNETRRSSPR